MSTSVSAEQIKQLRETTGAGMLDCRKALVENNGDMNNAIDWLRKKGLSAAAKKSGRVAAEGVVAVAASGNRGAVIELNSETDFVSRNEQFQQLARTIAQLALETGGDVEKLKAAAYPGTGRSVAEEIVQAISVIGENITLRRTAVLTAGKGIVASYIHSAVSPGMGKIGVLVALESDAEASKLEALGKQLAMHIAASNPAYMDKSNLSEHTLGVEREAAGEHSGKLTQKYFDFESQVGKYKDRMTGERAFSEKQLEAKLGELAQTAPNVDELLGDYERQSVSEDRKEKQNADKTKKLLDVFFQEAAYLMKKIRSYGDEAAIKLKLAEMRIERFFEEVVLHEQTYVIDGKSKISQVLAEAEKSLGAPVKLTGFVSYRLGEGIEKQQSDFAAEVAAAAGTAAA